MKITKTQRRHLAALLAAGGVRSSYPGLTMGTLAALERRGLVQSKYGAGSMAFPHTSIIWRLTASGRKALAA